MAEMKECVLMKAYEENGVKAVVDYQTGTVDFYVERNMSEFSLKLEEIEVLSDMMTYISLREGICHD